MGLWGRCVQNNPYLLIDPNLELTYWPSFFTFHGNPHGLRTLMIVIPDGYGLSYGIGADYIRWTITSVKDTRDGAVLKHYLAEAATEVRAMMENAAKEVEPVKAKL